MTFDMAMDAPLGKMALNILGTIAKISDTMYKGKWTLEMVEYIQAIGVRICCMEWENSNTQMVTYSKVNSKWEYAVTMELQSIGTDQSTKASYKSTNLMVKESFFRKTAPNTVETSSKSSETDMESKHIPTETTIQAGGIQTTGMDKV